MAYTHGQVKVLWVDCVKYIAQSLELLQANIQLHHCSIAACVRYELHIKGNTACAHVLADLALGTCP